GVHNTACSLDAIHVRHVQVHHHHVRFEARGPVNRLSATARLTHEFHPCRSQQGAHPFPEHRVIVSNQHPDTLHAYASWSWSRAGSGCTGNRARTRVPHVSPGSITHVPPSSAARSRMDIQPTPACVFARRPTPSSLTSSLNSEAGDAVSESLRLQVWAWAWRTTLVRASNAIR